MEKNCVVILLLYCDLKGLEGELYYKTTKCIATKGCWKSILQVGIVLKYNYCIAT